MPFELGNQEAKKGNHQKPRMITQKLIASLKDAEGAKLDSLVRALVLRASEGDVPAIREIFDRVEGKVPQAVIGGNEDDPAIRFEQLVRTIVRPKHSDG